MGSNFTCPHCKGTIKCIPQGRGGLGVASPRSSQFENVAQFTPPNNPVKKLWWFMKGNKAYIPSEPRPNDVTIQIEVWDKGRNIVTFDHMDKRIKLYVVQDIARMIKSGHEWSKPNLVRFSPLSENATRIYFSEFRRLGYLEVSENNRSTITPGGTRFLRRTLYL